MEPKNLLKNFKKNDMLMLWIKGQKTFEPNI